MTVERRMDYRNLSDLRPDPRNPKSHHLELLGESVSRFGFVEPLVVDERTGYLVAGHGRLATLIAMHKAGSSPPEGVIRLKSGVWQVPVVVGWASANDAEAAAALIALNRTSELGGWADDALLDLLDVLAADTGGMEGVGFTERDRQGLEMLTSQIEDDDEDDDNDGWHPETDEDDGFDDEDAEPKLVGLHIVGLRRAEVDTFNMLQGRDETERFRLLMRMWAQR